MLAGKLDRRITIQRKTVSHDALNEPVEVWNGLATVWAQRLGQTGQEFFANDQVLSEYKVIFRIRWRRDLKDTDRVMFEGRAHDIHSIRELGRRVGLELQTVTQD